ncbi:MAG: AMP-binding protein [Pseudohongiella sp.]|uniref:AMP-binding protein n=1 Tax=Pseudohongiella sp. TaxID=1979412 RepID=UPI0034A02A71
MWWQQPGLLESWLDDFLSDALQRRGLGELLLDDTTQATDLLTQPGHFGFASLDMVDMARRFAHALGIERTGLSDLLLARRSAQGWAAVARRSLDIDHSTLYFYSSGSTGKPTPSAHTLDKLQREINAFRHLLPPPKRVVSTVPTHHIYGFIWSVLLPTTLNCERIRVHPARSLPSTWAKELRDDDLIVATPDIWSMLLAHDVALPDRFTGISSTAPLPETTASGIRAQYPGAVLMEVYGSSETAGLAWRQQDKSAFTLLPYWQLLQDQGQWIARDKDDGQQYPLHDQLQQHGDSSISLLGRIDPVVQINGNNINLAELENKLKAHADVADARVRSDSAAGQTGLHYFIVPEHAPSDMHGWCRDFSRWLAATLGNTPPPLSVVVAPALPVNTLNKPVGWTPSHYKAVTGCFRSGFVPA